MVKTKSFTSNTVSAVGISANDALVDINLSPLRHRLALVDAFLATDFGAINTKIETAELRVGDLVAAVDPVLRILGVGVNTLELIDPAASRALLGRAGMIASALEKHAQSVGEIPGVGLRLTPDLEEFLLHHATVAQRPARDDHLTYWTDNDPTLLRTFTGDDGERFFIETVRLTQFNNTTAADALLVLRTGELTFGDPEATTALQLATKMTSEIWDAFSQFHKKLPSGFFGSRMRQYLLPYPVGGRLLTGPNATNSDGPPRLDFALGMNRLPSYIETVKGRHEFMLADSVKTLKREATLWDLQGALCAELGVGDSCTVDELRAALQAAPANVQKAACEFVALATKWRQLSGIHAGAIKQHLERWAANLTPEERRALRPSPGEGVSGRGLQATYDIHAARQNAWAVTTLARAIAPKTRASV